jgi:hypothetical protein
MTLADYAPVFQTWGQFIVVAIVVAIVLWAMLMAWLELR